MTASTIDEVLPVVVRVMKQVGDFQCRHFRQMPAGSGDEKSQREFVSEVDIQSERQLIEGLKHRLPDVGFFGEETGRQGNQQRVWIIDPLDGTTNFLSGLDQFSISVALVDQGLPVLGVVYKPVTSEWFTATQGTGFQHNNQIPAVIPFNLQLSQALIGTGFPYRSPDLAGSFFPASESILYASRGIRRFGSAALDLSYLAAGYLQGFWESDLQPYDVAAALLFLQLRGCLVTNERGSKFDMFNDRILVAGWPSVHQELLPRVSEFYATHRE